MKNFLYRSFVGGVAAWGLLLLRLVVGAALMLHGWGKIQNPFGWMGPDAPVPGVLQSLAALSEFGGGLALILGLLTPVAAFGIACTMATAILMVHVAGGDPFVNPPGRRGGSYELALTFFAVAVLTMLAGPGVLSLDYLLFGRGSRVAPTDETTRRASVPTV